MEPSETAGEVPGGATRRGPWLDWLLGLTLVVGYVALQTVYLQPPHPFDPANYFFTALDLPDVPADLFSLRIGLLLPLWAATAALGPSEAALYLIPYIAGVVLVTSTFGLARLLFRHRLVAFASGALVVANPYVLSNSSFLFPDLPATAAFTAGLFLVVAAALRHRRGDDDSWKTNLLLVAGGALVGWSYLIREFSPLLFPLVLLVVVLYRLPLRRVAIVAGAALAVFGVELAWGALVYGNPFIHATLLLGRQSQPPEPHKLPSIARVRELLDTPLDAALTFPRILLEWNVGWLFLALAILLLIATFLRKERGLAILATWVFGYWVVLSALGLVVPPNGGWILNITNLRYWYPIFPPLVIGGLAGLYGLLAKLPRKGRVAPVFRLLALGVAVWAAFLGVSEFHQRSGLGPASAKAYWHEFRQTLSMPDTARYQTIWTDSVTARILPIYTHTTFGSPVWDGVARSFFHPSNGFRREAALDGDLVLIDTRMFAGYFRSVFRRDGHEAPGYIIDPPDGWSLLLATTDGRLLLYAVDPGDRSRPVLSAGGEGERSWLVAPGSDFGTPPGSPLSESSPSTIELERGEKAFVRSSPISIDTSDPGVSFRIDTQLGTRGRGRGRLAVGCSFSDSKGRKASAEATGAYSSPAPFRGAEFVCRIPPALGKPLRLEVELRFWGPLEVELGEVDVDLAAGVESTARSGTDLPASG